MDFLDTTRSDSPPVPGLPHAGTNLLREVAGGLNDNGPALANTDWHIRRLHDGLAPDVTAASERAHQHVIDVNRDPVDDSLYPDQNTATLCRLTDFGGTPICRDRAEPDQPRIAARRVANHAAPIWEIELEKELQGFAILYDHHSIRSRIPFLFDGALSDFNICANRGAACALEIEQSLAKICEAAPGCNAMPDGCFQGGWTKRRHGQPNSDVNAIRAEQAQLTCLTRETSSWDHNAAKADRLRASLQTVIQALGDWRSA